MSFNIISDILVEGNEVIEFELSEVVMNDILNNTIAASVDRGSYWKTVVTIADHDGEICVDLPFCTYIAIHLYAYQNSGLVSQRRAAWQRKVIKLKCVHRY